MLRPSPARPQKWRCCGLFTPRTWADWEKRPAGYRRSALHWITSAKRDETRVKRLAQLIEDSAAGRRLAQYDWQKK